MVKIFLKKTNKFVLGALGLILFSIFIPRYVLSLMAEFQFPNSVKSLVVGHSHSQYAFNDSVIDNFLNLSSAGESYFYTYPKLVKVINNNPQIENVFIEFSNGQIESRMEDWIWGFDKMSNYYPQYSPFIKHEDTYLLLKKNRKDFIPTISISSKKNLAKLITFDFDYTNDLGGYKNLEKSIMDSLLNKWETGIREPEVSNPKISKIHLDYLRKMIDFCKMKKIKIYLVRSPQHKYYNYLANEKIFQQIRKEQFGDVEFLDFNNFPLDKSEFADFAHLNTKGALKFSIWFDKLLENGLFAITNKDELIAKELEILKNNSKLTNSIN